MHERTAARKSRLGAADETKRIQNIRRLGEVVVQSVRDMFTDSAPHWAAAIAYYSLLSTFPLILATASIAAYFVDPQMAASKATQLLGEFIPKGVGEIEALVQEAIAVRGTVGLFSIGTLLWTGSRVFNVSIKALNIAFDVDETYGFLKRTLVEVGMMLSIGLIFVTALASGWLIRLVSNVLELLPAGQGVITDIVQRLVPAFLLFLAFFLTYRFAPRTRPTSRAAVSGAATATALFLVARPLFLFYVERFASYNLIYGSIAIVAILALWAWIVALILLFGGEIASHVQAIMIEGRSSEEVARRHQERQPDRRSAV